MGKIHKSLKVDLNNSNLVNNSDEGDPDTIILIRRLAWHTQNTKLLQKI